MIIKSHKKQWVDFLEFFKTQHTYYTRGEYLVSDNSQIASDQMPFLQSSSHDDLTKEVLSRLDSIDPKYRPSHRIGVFGKRVYYVVKYRLIRPCITQKSLINGMRKSKKDEDFQKIHILAL
jgi:hypothetical protein